MEGRTGKGVRKEFGPLPEHRAASDPTLQLGKQSLSSLSDVSGPQHGLIQCVVLPMKH